MHLQQIISLIQLRGRSRFHNSGVEVAKQRILFFVTGPILLFLLGYLAFPSTVVEWDLESYYYTYARLLWTLVALYLVTAALFRPVVLGSQFVSWENLIRATGVALCLLLGFTKRRLVHTIGVTSASVLLFIYVALFTFRWD